jgi:hypothetical protein
MRVTRWKAFEASGVVIVVYCYTEHSIDVT